MHTVRRLIVSGGGVYSWGRSEFWRGGGSEGGSALWGVCLLRRGCLPHCIVGRPTSRGQTNMSKNTSFPQLCLRAVTSDDPVQLKGWNSIRQRIGVSWPFSAYSREQLSLYDKYNWQSASAVVPVSNAQLVPEGTNWLLLRCTDCWFVAFPPHSDRDAVSTGPLAYGHLIWSPGYLLLDSLALTRQLNQLNSKPNLLRTL